MQNNLLAGLRVLVTRPAHQAQTLCNMITERGGQAIRFPVIAIKAIQLAESSQALLENLNNISFAIFISPNAVEYGLQQIRHYGELPDTLKLVTIGRASAQKMQQLIARKADIYPKQQYTSEALLALESLQADSVNHKHILIFRGCGGRELLADTLRSRGAKVDYMEVYQRITPEFEPQLLATIWQSDAPDIITVTSNEGLTNLVSMHGEQYHQQLIQTPLVVVTEKMRQKAQNLGFNNTIAVASKASNEALMESIQSLKNE